MRESVCATRGPIRCVRTGSAGAARAHATSPAPVAPSSRMMTRAGGDRPRMASTTSFAPNSFPQPNTNESRNATVKHAVPADGDTKAIRNYQPRAARVVRHDSPLPRDGNAGKPWRRRTSIHKAVGGVSQSSHSIRPLDQEHQTLTVEWRSDALPADLSWPRGAHPSLPRHDHEPLRRRQGRTIDSSSITSRPRQACRAGRLAGRLSGTLLAPRSCRMPGPSAACAGMDPRSGREKRDVATRKAGRVRGGARHAGIASDLERG
jgi:hypothetical protein